MAKRKRFKKVYEKRGKKRKIFFILKLISGLFLSSILFFVAIFIYYAKDLPRPEKFAERLSIQPTKIYDKTGEVLLYEIYGEEKRIIVPLEKVPKFLQEAVIATEDANFYRHFGIDWKGIGRSILVNLKLRKPVYGGSTISQQLIRSTFLTLKKTAERKIREIILTLELERRYPKDQILEWYLNQIPFGSNAYGVEAASQTFFEKSVAEISLSEAATLAALIKAPSLFSPYGENRERLLARKDYVLDQMVKRGFLEEEKSQEAKKEEVVFAKILHPIKAPHFVMYVREYLESKYGRDFLMEKGLKVYTTLDWELQELAEDIIEQKMEEMEGRKAYNAGLVAIDPKTGHILTMVGSKDWFADPYPGDCTPGKDCSFEPYPNVALSPRQPGSAFKPFVYITAFGKGYDDEYIVIDEETNFGIFGGKPYIPRNYDGLFRGPVTLREALAQSLNVPSVKVLTYLAGLEDSIKTAKSLGITTLNEPLSFYGPSLVLGGGDVELLDMVSAYGVFATEGLRIDSSFILKIEDEKGNVLEKNEKTPKRILEPETCRLINDILSDNEARAPVFGHNSSLHFPDYQVAVKTGTTQNYKDAWTVGYSPSISVGVWVGNNDGAPMRKGLGVYLAGPIWREFIEDFLSEHPIENFQEPTTSGPE